MDNVCLNIAETHVIVDSVGGYSHIPGSVSISAPIPINPEIKIELLRTIYPVQYKSHPLKAIRPSGPARSVQHAIEHAIQHAPDEIDHDGQNARLEFNFALPVPSDLPVTTDTTLGSVSYAITATISAAGIQKQHSQPINIRRLVLSNSISYIRRYPDRVITKLCISQEPQDARHQVKWMARSTIRQGKRDVEIKYLVAKELNWRVDETVKSISISKSKKGSRRRKTTHQKQITTLCHGQLTGRWVAKGQSPGDNDTIEIPFPVSLPSALIDIDASSYHEGTAITIEHHLHLEVIAGEDTFHRQTGDLVDRIARDKSYRCVFPFPVQEVADGDGAVLRDHWTVTAPPVYQHCDPLLPAYEVTALVGDCPGR